MRVAIVWTLVLGAVLATVLTTEGHHLDRDGEGPWLQWLVPGLWLTGVAVLVLAGRLKR